MRLRSSLLLPLGAIALIATAIISARLVLEDEKRNLRDWELEAAVAANRFATGLSP